MNEYRLRYRKFAWVLTLLVVLASGLSVGWDCSGAWASTSMAAASSAPAAGMACHGSQAATAERSSCGMACCNKASHSAPSRPVPTSTHQRPGSCMTPTVSQADAIIATPEQLQFAPAVIPVSPATLPDLSAVASAPAYYTRILVPPRETGSRSLPSRAPPELA